MPFFARFLEALSPLVLATLLQDRRCFLFLHLLMTDKAHQKTGLDPGVFEDWQIGSLPIFSFSFPFYGIPKEILSGHKLIATTAH